MQNTSDKKSQIIDAAESLFKRYGYSKTSLDDIAKQACLGKGTIYYYFESKEDIFLEVAYHHSELFYTVLKHKIAKASDFEDKFSIAIRLPIKLVYEHAPVLLDAIKNLPQNYLQKLDAFRIENKLKMIEILNDVITEGIKQNVITTDIPADKLVNIIYDWFLFGDTNIIIKYPEVFIKKAEIDYEWIVQMILYGIMKRGNKL